MRPYHKALPVHAIWCLLAISSFAIGYFHDETSSAVKNSITADSLNPRDRARAGGENGMQDRFEQSRNNRQSNSPSEGMIARLFGGNPDASIASLARLALRDPNQITRRLAYSRLIESMTAENAEEIRAQFAELGADSDQWRDFHFTWGAIAGKAAFDSPANIREGALADTLAGWAAAKPEEALALFENLPSSFADKRKELARGIVSGLAASNRLLATDLVLRLSQQGMKESSGFMEIVATETLRAEGADAASQWSDSLPDGSLKGAAMGRIAEEFARRDPEAAAAWAQRHASEDYAAYTIERISGQWTARNPEAAVSWLETLPAGKGQAAGLRTAFDDWEDRDPVSAGQYLLSMPSSAQRDTAISGFSSGYAWQDPPMAIQWANSISDVSMRQRSLTFAGQIYYRQNPDAARTWLQSSGLPPEIQQQITSPVRR